MRHLVSVILALILSPLIYVTAGFAAVKFGEANRLDAIELGPAALGLASALAAGGLYAILVMARLSPIGPILSGLAYLGVTLWSLFALDGFLSTMPASLFGVSDVLHVPAGFGTALLAVPLLSTVFSARRWRNSAQPAADAYDAAPPYPASTDSAAPLYDLTPSYSAPVYTPSASQPTVTDLGDETRPTSRPG